MISVGRYTKVTARPGQGEALAQKLLGIAESLRDAPGCELYVINGSHSEPHVVWVTEQWRSQELLDEALQMPAVRERMPEVLALVISDGFERIDVEPLGGVGYSVGETGFAIVNLDELEDMAAKSGFGETGEARFARTPLGSVGLGVSLQRLRPGVRQSFGHLHHCDEEIYVILDGNGRVAVDSTIQDVKPFDAIRVAPGQPERLRPALTASAFWPWAHTTPVTPTCSRASGRRSTAARAGSAGAGRTTAHPDTRCLPLAARSKAALRNQTTAGRMGDYRGAGRA